VNTFFDLTGAATRILELQEAGRLLGFEFLGRMPAGERQALGVLPYVGKARRGRVTGYLRRTQDGETLALFDFAYRHHKRRHAQTVAALASPRLDLPAFAVRPERILDRLIPLIGHRDIDFEGSPVFSRRYFLRGEDEAAVRALFTPERRTAFENVEPCGVAASGRRLVYFEPDRLVWPGALDAFLERATRIVGMFR